MFCRDGGLVAIPDVLVMSRHDLYSGLIEFILDVGMQAGINHCILLRSSGVSVDLVGDIPVIQTGLQYKWLSFNVNTFGR